MDPTKRLLFWLRIPYVADAALVLIGVWLLLSGRSVGWWVLVFAAVRAVIGTIALFWLAPKLIARRNSRGDDAP
jgi:membrane protein YdbS with pleckstrin-like domain